jgi:hypothetical protein
MNATVAVNASISMPSRDNIGGDIDCVLATVAVEALYLRGRTLNDKPTYLVCVD